MIRIIDTDVVALAVSKLKDVVVDKLWIAFATDKHFRYLATHDIAAQLGPQKAKALPVLHALTGCDTVSFFFWQRETNSLGYLECVTCSN